MRRKIPTAQEAAALAKRVRTSFGERDVVKQSEHYYRIGLAQPYYVDFDNLIVSSEKKREITQLYLRKIDDLLQVTRIDALAFIEKAEGGTIGALRLEGAISMDTNLPSFPVRLGKDVECDRIKIPRRKGAKGSALEGTHVVLVTDHVSTGDEILTAADSLRAAGAIVKAIVAHSIRADLLDWKEFKERDIDVRATFEFPRDLMNVAIAASASA